MLSDDRINERTDDDDDWKYEESLCYRKHLCIISG